jgi:hypothetical protein
MERYYPFDNFGKRKIVAQSLFIFALLLVLSFSALGNNDSEIAQNTGSLQENIVSENELNNAQLSEGDSEAQAEIGESEQNDVPQTGQEVPSSEEEEISSEEKVNESVHGGLEDVNYETNISENETGELIFNTSYEYINLSDINESSEENESSENISLDGDSNGDIILAGVHGGSSPEGEADTSSEGYSEGSPEEKNHNGKQILILYKDNKKEIETEALREEIEAANIGKAETENSLEGRWVKNVVVYSQEHYDNELTVYTNIEEIEGIEDSLKIYWMSPSGAGISGEKTDITDNPDFRLEFYDTDGDELSDRISWIVPHLSEQIFEIVINLSSGGNSSSEQNVSINQVEVPSGEAENPVRFEFNITYNASFFLF